MVYFQTKNPNSGTFWSVLDLKMLVHLLYFMGFWDILWPLSAFCVHLVHFSWLWYLSRTKKNLATLSTTVPHNWNSKLDLQQFRHFWPLFCSHFRLIGYSLHIAPDWLVCHGLILGFSTFLSIIISVFLSLCLSVSLSFYLSLFILSACLSICHNYLFQPICHHYLLKN
jgi:energy-coupling factor transporter transmembrane protein EcfT